MYIPHAKEMMKDLLDYRKFHYEKLAVKLGQEVIIPEDVCYDFHSFEGNIEAIIDMLYYVEYSPEQVDIEKLAQYDFESEYPCLVIATADDDEMKFFVEVRHPYYSRPKGMLILQEQMKDQGSKYFIVDSFPDFWEQYLEFLYKDYQ